MDHSIVQAEASTITVPSGLTTTEELDAAADRLIAELSTIADHSTPRRKYGSGEGVAWWSREVEDAVQEARRARRRYQANPSRLMFTRWQEANKVQKNIITREKQRLWRKTIARASSENKDVWALARWARLRSHAPTASTMPPLRRPHDDNNTPAATTHADKARILAEKFFPCPPADLSDIADRSWVDRPHPNPVPLNREVTAEDVAEVCGRTAPWKAAGTEDNIPVGLLKACGMPAFKAVAALASASLEIEYFPRRFKLSGKVLLPKPSKTTQKQGLCWRMEANCTAQRGRQGH